MEVMGSWVELKEFGAKAMLAMMGIWAVGAVIPCLLFMPGIVTVAMLAATAGLVALLAWPLNGDCLIRGSTEGIEMHLSDFCDERWIFINGSTTR